MNRDLNRREQSHSLQMTRCITGSFAAGRDFHTGFAARQFLPGAQEAA